MNQVLRGRAATEHLTLNGHVQDLGTGPHSELISIQDTVFVKNHVSMPPARLF